MSTTTTSYSVLSLGDEGVAAAGRGFGLDAPIDPKPAVADAFSSAATSTSARSA